MKTRTEKFKQGGVNRPRLARRGGAMGVIVALVLIVGIGGGVFYWVRSNSHSSKKVNLIFAAVERGTFVHEVNGKGSAESASNVDVASQVEGQATIIYLIDEGADVKKGDLLVELDSSDISEKLDSQIVQTNSSRATLNSSRATLRSAEISLEEYVEGTFEQSWMDYENTIFEAEQTRKQSADSARFTERLLNLNYSTELQYEIDKVAERKAENSLTQANLKKQILLKYTSEKQITSLMSDIETATAKVDSDKNSYNINLNREKRYQAQLANCKIRAPQDGQVVYANPDSRRMSESEMIKEGSTVRQRQVLIRLPDKTQMQVRTMINESNISSVKTGMKAKISFDSIPDRVIDGEVVKVNLYPEIVWMSSAKDYVTLVKINEELEELRSGLTAQVRIIADQQENVLMVPVHCVTEYGKKTFCITFNDGVWGCREVLLGASNEKQVIVLKGLEEGDLVVTGARNYRENVNFPDPNEPSLYENDPEYQEHLAQAKAEEQEQAEREASGEMAGGPGGPGAGGMPGLGGMPGMGALPAGVTPEMAAQFAQRVRNGEISGADLARIRAFLGGNGGGPSGMGGEVDEESRKKQEEATEYAKTIEANLAHDVKVAAIEHFFTRTVMEMQRELITAIKNKTDELSARIAARQNEITRRQEDVEILQKSLELGSVNAETTQASIDNLIDEIKLLRGDSDADPLERIVYNDMIDWSKYVHRDENTKKDLNDITKEGLMFLAQDSDVLFNEIFPNSSPVDVVTKASDSSDVVVVAVEDEPQIEIEPSQDEIDFGDEDAESTGEDYSAFLPLFDDWDHSDDDSLRPAEFVIGFFTDRKSFLNSESDEEIDDLFTELAGSSEVSEIAMDEAAKKVDQILRERQESPSGSGRGGRGGRGPRGMGGFGMGGPRGDASEAGENGRPSERPQAPRGERPARPADGGDANNSPTDGVTAPANEKAPGDRPALPGGFLPPVEPIKSLAEATSLRQAIAFYVDRMDFNSDGILQKSEFIKGYHEVEDVASKLFASSQTINPLGGSGPAPGGMPGGGPR